MRPARPVTVELVRSVFSYDPESGVLLWVKPQDPKLRGRRAGFPGASGHRFVGIGDRHFGEHRVIWFYMTGEWPADQLDHINGVRDDNRWVNLREATNAENQQNVKLKSHNTSGMTGVSFHRQRKKWRASIAANGRQFHLGLFDTPEAARERYLQAKRELHTFQPVPRDLAA